jgi:hypothetical protein
MGVPVDGGDLFSFFSEFAREISAPSPRVRRCARRSLSQQHHVGKDGRRRYCLDNQLGRRYTTVCQSAVH